MITALPRTLFLVILFCPPVMVHGTTPDEHKDVAVTVALSDSLVRPGDTTFVVVRFTPAGGFSLNADPPPVLLLRASSWYVTDSSLGLPVNTDTGYLDTTRPLRKAVLVAQNGQKGAYFITGTLRYYYCSDIEGWCTRSIVEFELPLTIVQ